MAYILLHVCSNGSISTATPFSSSITLTPPNSSPDPLNARTLPFCSSHTVLISLPKYASYTRTLNSVGNRKNRLPSCSYVTCPLFHLFSFSNDRLSRRCLLHTLTGRSSRLSAIAEGLQYTQRRPRGHVQVQIQHTDKARYPNTPPKSAEYLVM
jgi:hypothetical protein